MNLLCAACAATPKIAILNSFCREANDIVPFLSLSIVFAPCASRSVQSLASNRKLREQIDDLRRERVVFDNIYKKLEKELHEKKRQMANVIELSNMTYEQRDNCQMEITAIDQANRKEQEDFEEQMIELGRMLEQDFKLQTSKSAPVLKTTGGLSPGKDKKGKKEKVRSEASDQTKTRKRGFSFLKTTNGIALYIHLSLRSTLSLLSSAGPHKIAAGGPILHRARPKFRRGI